MKTASPMLLTVEEIQQLTNRMRCDGQRRELDFMGIPYKVRRDGSLVVVRVHVEGPDARTPPEPPEPKMWG